MDSTRPPVRQPECSKVGRIQIEVLIIEIRFRYDSPGMAQSDRWRKVEEIFSEALARPTVHQRSFVEARCGTDAEVRDQVIELLGASRDMGGFLQTNVFDLRGQTFGSYRAVEEAGRGGMSVIYRGERIDGSFDKPVAIKVVFADAALLPETRILASLEHPNVARLLDAGVTPLGLRYLVMEFVEGVPCTDWANGRSEAEKLRVFLRICDGVQAAHRALIVHRDLKPENVLVTAEGTVKLLDFGIAKQLAPVGGQTAGLRAYTPDYASPEQILGKPASTANDIFSLGVILCEMLTAKRPYQLTGIPLDEVLDTIERGAPRVSIEGDLGHIVRKALQAAPDERYPSAADLGRDVENYLAHRPIAARPVSFGYRARKFLARNRWPVAAAAVVAVALGTAIATALWQARLARQRFDLVRKLSGSVLFELHDAVEKLPGSLPAREVLVKRSIEYLDGLAQTAGSNTELQTEIARGFMRLSHITGNSYKDLGRAEEGAMHAERALEIMRAAMARAPRDLDVRHQYFAALDTRLNSFLRKRDLAKAKPMLQQLTETAQVTLSLFPREAVANLDFARSKDVTSSLLEIEDPGSKEVPVALAAAVAAYRQVLAMKPDDLDAKIDMSRCLFELAAWHHARDPVKSKQYALEAYGITKPLAEAGQGTGAQGVIALIGILANLARQEGDFEESSRLFREQLGLARKAVEAEPASASPKGDLGAAYYYICGNSMSRKKFEEALENCELSLTQLREVHRIEPDRAKATRFLLFGINRTAELYASLRQPARACALAREAEPLFAKLGPAADSAANKTVRDSIRKRLATCPPR